MFNPALTLLLGFGTLALAARPASSIPKPDRLFFSIDGAGKYHAGTNAYWLAFLENKSDVDVVLDHMAAANLSILRIWGFNDVNEKPRKGTAWFQSFGGSEPEINTSGPDGLTRLDYAVKAAERRGVRLLIPFVNNWNEYGGMRAYYQWCLGRSGDDPALKEDWYKNVKCQSQYQKYIKTIVARYKNSPAIFAWELANEPRCNGCNVSVITEWAKKTAREIKKLDPIHMVAVGDEGFGLNTTGSDSTSYPYQFDEGTDFLGLISIPDIDFGTFHLYPDHWGITPDWGDRWIRNHAAQCVKVNKPCLFEEYGVMAGEKCSQERGWQKVSVATKGVAGDMFWQYGDQISIGKTADDNFTVYRNTKNWDCMILQHGKDIAVGLKEDNVRARPKIRFP